MFLIVSTIVFICAIFILTCIWCDAKNLFWIVTWIISLSLFLYFLNLWLKPFMDENPVVAFIGIIVLIFLGTRKTY